MNGSLVNRNVRIGYHKNGILIFISTAISTTHKNHRISRYTYIWGEDHHSIWYRSSDTVYHISQDFVIQISEGERRWQPHSSRFELFWFESIETLASRIPKWGYTSTLGLNQAIRTCIMLWARVSTENMYQMPPSTTMIRTLPPGLRPMEVPSSQ